MAQTPQAVITYKVYVGDDSKDMLGTSEVTLPALEAMTVDVQGAGISGTVNMPVLGHFTSQTLTLNFRTVVEDLQILTQQKAHHMELHGAIQLFDEVSGEFKVVPHVLILRVIPKNLTQGTFGVAALQGTTFEFEVIYCRSVLNNVELFELDKYNGKYSVNGVNLSEAIWRAIGRM